VQCNIEQNGIRQHTFLYQMQQKEELMETTRIITSFEAFFCGLSVILFATAAHCQEGAWTKCQVPVPIDLNYPNGAGAQSVVVDPVRPSDFYAFVSAGSVPTAVLKSTDFGATWTNVNTTSAMVGNPWGAAIDPNPNRNRSTPPTMYAPQGYGTEGLWKSTDGGVTWVNLLDGVTPFSPYNEWGGTAADVYAIAILPDNPPNHLIITFHSWNGNDAGLGESTDGGASWIVHTSPAGFGGSNYMVIIDKDTWLSIAGYPGGNQGVWKTSSAGRVNGAVSPAAWKCVDPMLHVHGAFQPLVTASAVYVPGMDGIKRSTDNGETWTLVYNSQMSSVAATANYLYANSFYSIDFRRSSIKDGSTWSTYTAKPADLTTGAAPFGNGVSFDGTHWILVIGCDSDGLWRYVEPASATATQSRSERPVKSAIAQITRAASRPGLSVNPALRIQHNKSFFNATGRQVPCWPIAK
jgi:hypothetical protein